MIGLTLRGMISTFAVIINTQNIAFRIAILLNDNLKFFFLYFHSKKRKMGTLSLTTIKNDHKVYNDGIFS